MSNLYSECMFLALVIQHAMRMWSITLPSVTCPAVQYYSTLSNKLHGVRNKVLEHKMCVLIFSTLLSETFVTLRRIDRDIVISV